MLIETPYNYKSIQRVDTENGRRYLVGDKKLPSVTTILSKMQDMTHLDEWRADVGEEKADKITSEASTLGTAMHTNLENYILKKPMSGSFMAKTLANVIVKKGLCNVDAVWGMEVALYSEDLYAGTCDLIGIHKGIPAIMDYKNSLKEKKKEWIEGYLMQLCAYAIAHNEMFGTNIHKGVVMIATRDAKYQEFIIEGAEFTHYETMWVNKVCAYYDQFGSDK